MPSVSADIYVMGTPVAESYKTTLTKGTFNGSVSLKSGGSLLKASVDISKGNEGGPLLDKNANVLGITKPQSEDSTYLAVFVPIKEALKALNIQLKKD